MGLIFLPILEIESEIVNRSAAIFQYDIVHQDRSLTLRINRLSSLVNRRRSMTPLKPDPF